MAADFKPTTVYSMQDLKDMLPCSPETFLDRLQIPRRINGVYLGADICAAMERCAQTTREGLESPEPKRQFTKAPGRRPGGTDPLQPLNAKSIVAMRGNKR